MWLQVLCASLSLPPSTRICHSSTLSKNHYFDSFSSLPPPISLLQLLWSLQLQTFSLVWKLNLIVFILVFARCNSNNIVNRLEQEAHLTLALSYDVNLCLYHKTISLVNWIWVDYCFCLLYIADTWTLCSLIYLNKTRNLANFRSLYNVHIF